MLKLFLSASLLAAAPLAAHGQLVPGAPTTDWDRARSEYSVAILRQYNDLINEWHEKLRSGEAARSAESYADQARLMISGLPPVQSRDSIRNFFHSIDNGLIELRTGLTDFVASDNLAYAAGPVVYRFRDDTGATRSRVGTHVTVITRENRRWRIRTQVLSYESES